MVFEKNTKSASGVPWVYAQYEGHLYLLPEAALTELSEMYDVVFCGSWLEVSMLGEERLSDALGRAGYGDYEQYCAYLAEASIGLEEGELMAELDDPDCGWPSPDDEFDVQKISSYADGDWPPDLRSLMMDYLPVKIIENYGDSYTTTFSGDFVVFDAKDTARILAACRRMGLRMTKSKELEHIALYQSL